MTKNDAAASEADFVWRVRVYWEDTDAGGVVYYANYLKFMERARTEWLRARGVVQSELEAQEGVVMVMRSIRADYLAPARLDDELDVTVSLANRRGASFSVNQEVWRTSDQTLLVRGTGEAACLDAKRWVPCRFPPLLRNL
ncbi:MAG: tol-pal system-associated acyl-CoA thioesterase [Lysobacterales bacterium]